MVPSVQAFCVSLTQDIDFPGLQLRKRVTVIVNPLQMNSPDMSGTQCRKTTGALVFTGINLPVRHFQWDTEEGLKPYSQSSPAYKTFESSPEVLRGFCRECGSSLIWYDTRRPEIEVLLGTVDDIRAANLPISYAVWPPGHSTHYGSVAARTRSRH